MSLGEDGVNEIENGRQALVHSEDDQGKNKGRDNHDHGAALEGNPGWPCGTVGKFLPRFAEVRAERFHVPFYLIVR